MLEKHKTSIRKILCNMKNKILFGCVSILFVAATAFNIGLLQTKDANDVSLDAITIMAQAHDGENNINGAEFVILMDGGSGTKCIDEIVHNYQIYIIYCEGSGNLPCIQGVYEYCTPTNKRCYFT